MDELSIIKEDGKEFILFVLLYNDKECLLDLFLYEAKELLLYFVLNLDLVSDILDFILFT